MSDIFGNSPFTDVKDDMRELYKDLPRLLRRIIELHNGIFAPEEKQIFEKTAADVSDDIISAKADLSLDNMVKDSYAQVYNYQARKSLFYKKLELIPALFDFYFVYWVKFFDIDAAVYRFPMTELKLQLIASCIKTVDDQSDAYEIFRYIINDKFCNDLRQEFPPISTRTDMTYEELRDKLQMELKPKLDIVYKHLITMTEKKLNNMGPEERNKFQYRYSPAEQLIAAIKTKKTFETVSKLTSK